MPMPAKLEDVTKIIDKLTADLIKPSLLPHRKRTPIEETGVFYNNINRTRCTPGTTEGLWS